MSGFWRPERRNRNIGTSRSGFSKSNNMRIPESWQDKHGNVSWYYERLENVRHQNVTLGSHQLTVLYEQPRDGFTYGCTPPDVVRIFEAVLHRKFPLPDILVFRQPTRKQTQQRPVGGRAVYAGTFGAHEGTAIILEAQNSGVF